jgi:uncharacterized protein YcgI (DUF1989 family)
MGEAGQTGELHTVPARRGRAARLDAGQAIKIINTHGQQVVDFWAFNAADLGEYLSMEHLHAAIEGILPKAGCDLVTNQRRAILHFAEDTTPGIHDTLMAACDEYRYRLLGCEGYHDNCTDNLFEAMGELDLTPPECPSPLNLFMNIPVGPDGKTSWGSPLSKPGDYVVLRAVLDCVVAMSTCPQDMTPVNGPDQAPTEVHYQILG